MNDKNGELAPAASAAMATAAKQIPQGFSMQAPEAVLEQAARAARALQQRVEDKPHKVIINNEIFLEFEDWQMLGKFFGITAGAVSWQYIKLDGVRGCEAKSEALNAQGVHISGAFSICMADEPRWGGRVLNQLLSMAQTRANAKSLRNVLSWVVVLAGYQPTPAEEVEPDSDTRKAPAAAEPKPKRAKSAGVEASIAGVADCATFKDVEQYWAKEMDKAKAAEDTKWMTDLTKAKNARRVTLREQQGVEANG